VQLQAKQEEGRWPAPNSCRASVSPLCVQIAVQVQDILPKKLRHFPPFLHKMLDYLKLGHDHFFHSLSLFIFHWSSYHFSYWKCFVISNWASLLRKVSCPFAVQQFYSRLLTACHNGLTFSFLRSALWAVPILATVPFAT